MSYICDTASWPNIAVYSLALPGFESLHRDRLTLSDAFGGFPESVKVTME